MAVTRRTLSATALVLAGVVGAAVVGQLPAIGAPDRGFTVTPSSPGQALVCPGPAVAVGAEGTGADEVTASGRPSRTAGTASGGSVRSTPLKRGGIGGDGTAPRLLRADAAGKVGQIAGAQLEQVSTGDAAGLAAAACTPATADAWFAAGATTTGRTSVLLLANPSSAPAEVTVRLWTEDGAVDPVGGGTVAVPAGSRAAVPLSGLAPSAGALAVHVVSSGARIGAAVEQRTVRGLESGGLDITGPTAAPATRQVIPGLRIAGGAAVAQTAQEDDYGDLQPVVRVLLPGSRAADVAIVLQPAAGGDPVRLGRRVAAGVVTDFAVPALPDGTYTVRLSSSRPLLAGARVSVVGDASASSTPDDSTGSSTSGGGSGSTLGTDAGLVGGDGPVDSGSSGQQAAGSPTSTARGIDLAWLAAAEPLDATAAVAVVDAPSPVLTVSGDGTARTVRVTGATTGTLRVPAAGTVSLPVSPGVVVLRDAAGTAAAVSYGGAAAIAGYPVGPADQEARAVRVTR